MVHVRIKLKKRRKYVRKAALLSASLFPRRANCRVVTYAWSVGGAKIQNA